VRIQNRSVEEINLSSSLGGYLTVVWILDQFRLTFIGPLAKFDSNATDRLETWKCDTSRKILRLVDKQ
jgi:hypothetical protein